MYIIAAAGGGGKGAEALSEHNTMQGGFLHNPFTGISPQNLLENRIL